MVQGVPKLLQVLALKIYGKSEGGMPLQTLDIHFSFRYGSLIEARIE